MHCREVRHLCGHVHLLKNNAKQALRGRYWRSFWICLALSIAGLGGAGASSGSAARQAVDTTTGDTSSVYDILSGIPDSMLMALAVGALIGCGHRYLLGAVRAVPAQRGPLPLFYGEPPVPDPGLHCRQHLPPPLRQPHRCAVAHQFKSHAGLHPAHRAGRLLVVLLCACALPAG